MRNAHLPVNTMRAHVQHASPAPPMQRLGRTRRALLPVLLAVVAGFLAVGPARAGEVQLRQTGSQLIEVAGGSGANAWVIRYGTQAFMLPEPRRTTQVASGEGDTAWFSHGSWLRLLDTRKGVVIGRWRFPALIVGLKPEGSRVQVEILDEESILRSFRVTVLLDPAAPQVPQWPYNEWVFARVPWAEAGMLRSLAQTPVAVETAKRRLPEVEQTLARDALSPWIFVTHGKLLKDLGDARYRASLERAVRMPNLDFTELLPISSYLDSIGEHDLASEAFERGYRDFWQRGYDPRLFTILMNRWVLYSPPYRDVREVPEKLQAELIERTYRLVPNGEGAEIAWRYYADHLARTGPPDLAQLWEKRAREAGGQTGFFSSQVLTAVSDTMFIFMPAAVLALLLFVLVLYYRYRRQRKLDLAARKRGWGLARGFSFFGLEYWSRRDRFGFLLIVLAAWLLTGLASVYVGAILRLDAAPMAMGSGNLAGPVNAWYFENRLPPTPERDLLLALSYHQSGEREKAERLYRSLPQFPEAWNNLGVLLKEAGRENEAQQAFRRALELDPSLAEAALNLGQPPSTLWTELHQKYDPGRPMLAPPSPTRLVRAALSRTWAGIFADALAGPVRLGLIERLYRGEAMSGVRVASIVFLVALALAVAMIFLIPVREVSVPAARGHVVWEALFPGTSPVYAFLGGPVLYLWMAFLVQDLFIFWKGTARILTWIGTPNIATNYALPFLSSTQEMLKIGGPINPGWTWVLVAPLVIFAVNLFLVWRSRRAA